VRRVFIIAKSEFHTAVRARGFLVGIMLMPILFGSAVVLQRVVERQANQTLRRVAVVDETGQLFAPLEASAEAWNRGERDLGPKVAEGPQFTLESIAYAVNENFMTFCDRHGDAETVRIYREYIQPDERAHQQLGQRLLAKYATTPGLQGAARNAVARVLEIASAARSQAAQRMGTACFPGC